MSRNQRWVLVVAVVAVAIVAFVIARPGDDGDQTADTATQTTQTTQTETGTTPAEDSSPTATAPEPGPEKPRFDRIVFENGEVRGGAQTIEATTGDTVRIVVTSDVPDEVHLHGYDIEREVGPGNPARFVFKADLEGDFELETHETEVKLASVVVAPS